MSDPWRDAVAEVFAAEEHDPSCPALGVLIEACDSRETWLDYGPCTCSHDSRLEARIARKLEAALDEQLRHGCEDNYDDPEMATVRCACRAWGLGSEDAWRAHRNAAALAAFRAALTPTDVSLALEMARSVADQWREEYARATGQDSGMVKAEWPFPWEVAGQ